MNKAYRILVVDDDKEQTALIEEFLHISGFPDWRHRPTGPSTQAVYQHIQETLNTQLPLSEFLSDAPASPLGEASVVTLVDGTQPRGFY